jgi:hypothetical protein
MRGLLPARIAKLLRFQAFRVLLLVLARGVVAVLAIPALQRDDFSHLLFLSSKASSQSSWSGLREDQLSTRTPI